MLNAKPLRCSLCTISFRHMLVSFDQLIDFAKLHRFDGMEIWGTHARYLYAQRGSQSRMPAEEGLAVSMISDYLDVGSAVSFSDTIAKCEELLRCANWLQAGKLRTFAGMQGSEETSEGEFETMVWQLRVLGDLCLARGVELLVETHPGTLADNLHAAIRLMREVDHEAVKLNMDFLHIWEAGDDPLESYEKLEAWVEHFHLKNITSLDCCGVFQPHQVYAANGSRAGMTALPDGAIDYREIIHRIAGSGKFASLEWFGANPLETLQGDIRWLRHRLNRVAEEVNQH
ncbi:sugar phosphate isomerase/epimerase [Paenibacillus sp. PL2-23]|uniref:sugar phosphate isomerase/epimerase family protein n=1 Tax=Paenibacillus sp. PL2-23 TaxID=2100729 RepID=UPI0030F94AD0